MKVNKLIEELQKLPQDLEVVLKTEDDRIHSSVGGIYLGYAEHDDPGSFTVIRNKNSLSIRTDGNVVLIYGSGDPIDDFFWLNFDKLSNEKQEDVLITYSSKYAKSAAKDAISEKFKYIKKYKDKADKEYPPIPLNCFLQIIMSNLEEISFLSGTHNCQGYLTLKSNGIIDKWVKRYGHLDSTPYGYARLESGYINIGNLDWKQIPSRDLKQLIVEYIAPYPVVSIHFKGSRASIKHQIVPSIPSDFNC